MGTCALPCALHCLLQWMCVYHLLNMLSKFSVLSVVMIACVLRGRGRGRDGGLLDETLGRADLELFLGKFPVALKLS